ncbi:Osmotin-like protein OSM34 [Striga hermonthica]|uniref:Osmotin-like protein OSM34 n=1 Tax=Striga hermonthica TaxID=68872 RepID=A0A9N7P126_STRHE|nr:Osmotin-like protein OSM34 [Striga hermonthica]
MGPFPKPISSLPIFLLISLLSARAHGASFTVRNNCPFTVWAASVPVGGGLRLDRGQTWTINVPASTTGARIWARTGCSFDESGRGQCQTGDCNGQLQCQGYGVPPNTLAEYALNQFNNLDFYDISLVDGFNVPMEFGPDNSEGCSRDIECTSDINGQCPNDLRAPGGCNNPCTVYKTDHRPACVKECKKILGKKFRDAACYRGDNFCLCLG